MAERRLGLARELGKLPPTSLADDERLIRSFESKFPPLFKESVWINFRSRGSVRVTEGDVDERIQRLFFFSPVSFKPSIELELSMMQMDF